MDKLMNILYCISSYLKEVRQLRVSARKRT